MGSGLSWSRLVSESDCGSGFESRSKVMPGSESVFESRLESDSGFESKLEFGTEPESGSDLQADFDSVSDPSPDSNFDEWRFLCNSSESSHGDRLAAGGKNGNLM